MFHPFMVKPMDNTRPSGTFEEIKNTLSPVLAELTEYLMGQVFEFEPQIKELVEHCLKNGGKRIRPSLVFLTGDVDSPEIKEELIRVSAVVEMVHIATLVHDDILDKADKRRGLPTVSSKYGQHAAVLLGDALFSHALHLATQFNTIEVCRLVSKSTRRVCSGEILQTFKRGEWQIEMADYLEMLDMKTGELFAVSTYLGGLLSNYSPKDCELLREFGSQLGIAYQAYDDLTDFIGDESKIGKTLGTDLVTGKATLPLIQVFALKDEAISAALIKALESKDESKVMQILEDNQIFEKGIEFVTQLMNDSVEFLDQLSEDIKARTRLRLIAEILGQKIEELSRAYTKSK